MCCFGRRCRGLMATMAVRHFLAAMAGGGHKRAALYLPRVLSLVSRAKSLWSPEAAEQICSEWEAAAPLVPGGTLLPWVGQILTVVGQGESRAASAMTESLGRVAAAFPQQLYFPLRLSWPHFSPEVRFEGLGKPTTTKEVAPFSARVGVERCFPVGRWREKRI